MEIEELQNILSQIDLGGEEAPAVGKKKECAPHVAALVEEIWERGEVISGNDSALWRKDCFGAWMHRYSYQNRQSEFGWEMMETQRDARFYLLPLQWKNYLDFQKNTLTTPVVADGLRNIRKIA